MISIISKARPYFLVINRSVNPPMPTQIAQTKSLHGYGIGVEYHDGRLTLSGEVPTEIDKELVANLARETLGVKEVTNQIRITPEATPQPGEAVNQDLAINVEDLELQANLRERALSVPELKAQQIEIKVQNPRFLFLSQLLIIVTQFFQHRKIFQRRRITRHFSARCQFAQ